MGTRRRARSPRPRPPHADAGVSTARLTRPERAALTRRELLDAAQLRFFRDGYHATSLDDIADEAGYTKGAVYGTFKSKAGLFLALFDEVVERRVEEIRRLLAPHEDGAACTQNSIASSRNCVLRSSTGWTASAATFAAPSSCGASSRRISSTRRSTTSSKSARNRPALLLNVP